MYHEFKITMKTARVLSLVKQHRKTHVDEYEGQVQGWKAQMEIYAAQVSKWAMDGGEPEKRPNQPNKPRDYTEDYDNIIAMVQEHILENLVLSGSDFEKMIQDKFNWKEGFLHTSSVYNNKLGE